VLEQNKNKKVKKKGESWMKKAIKRGKML